MRKRDQIPDAIGLAVKRQLLEHIVDHEPEPDGFEDWLLRYAQTHEGTAFAGAVSAMARTVLEEWRMAHALPEFAAWLERGAPSDDTLSSLGPGCATDRDKIINSRELGSDCPSSLMKVSWP